MDRSSDSDEGLTLETRRLFDDQGAPLTTAEVADELDRSTEVASDALDAVAERANLRRKQVTPDTRVWWQDAEQQRERPQTSTESEQEAEFAAFIGAVRDYAIFMLDTEGTIRNWNEGAERIKGYAEAVVIGEHISIFYPDDSESDPDALDRLFDPSTAAAPNVERLTFTMAGCDVAIDGAGRVTVTEAESADESGFDD